MRPVARGDFPSTAGAWRARVETRLTELFTMVASVSKKEVTDGDLTVSGGGSVVVTDGGGVRVTQGGGLSISDGGDVQVTGGGRILAWAAEKYAQFRDGVLSAGTITPAGALGYPATSLLTDGVLAAASPSNWCSVRVGSDGAAEIGSTAGKIRVPYTSTSDSANTRILLSGELQMVTSSRRYKQDIEDAVVDVNAVLAMVGRTWRDRAQVETDPDTTDRYVGYIAEELHDLGLTEFVGYDEQGRPDSVAYDRLSVALLAVVKDLNGRVAALEQPRT